MPFFKNIIFIYCVVLSHTMLFALKKDSILIIKPAKHYFKTSIYSDFYSTSKRDLSGANFVSEKLKTYKLNQFVIGFNTPLYTSDYYNKDSTVISNFHLLFTGSRSLVIPIFSGIKNHYLSKTALGFRMIYNTGKKSIFFSDFSALVTKDRGYNYTRRSRTVFSFIYNYTLNKNFSFRLGVTRSFMLGNRFFLPYIGFRFGKIDGVNFNFQFPRSISFNFPIGKYIKTSIYTKPQGGIYSFANNDSLYYLNNDKNINFGRYEFLMGSRIDINPSKLFGFYLGGGITTRNGISMFSESYNRRNNGELAHFYNERISGAIFINIGLTFKFGKTKSIYNNFNLYDAIDLNNSSEAGDNNINTGNSEIPKSKSKIKDVKLSDIQDLIETQDLY
jgi:hypothetical protein